MKRTTKNILMILILLLSISGLIFSIITVKKELDNKPNISENMPKEMETNENVPLDMNGKPNENIPSINEKSIDLIDYLVFGVFSLNISLSLLYLIFSKFNKLDAADSLNNKLLFLLFTLVITGSLIFLSYYITNTQKDNKIINNTSKIEYNGKTTITESKNIDNEEFNSNSENQNAILVTGENEVHINNSTVSKTGDSNSGDNTSFYGINSAVLAKDKAKLYIDNMTVTTDANGANGVFSYGDSTVTITNSRITTSKDNSGGIMTTGGGTTNATNLEINTSGKSSAAIRSDRGGGLVNVNLGTYKTTGIGSPAIYSTANINVTNATLISEASEGIIIEGANSVNLNNVTLTDTNNKLNGQSTTYKNIFLYQSMSGDASEGIALFKATSSNITTNQGDTFYVTNTEAKIELSNNTFVNNDENGNFLRIQKDSWGKTNNNGGIVTMNLNSQNVIGNIVVDSISTLDLTLTDSTLETIINNQNEAKSITLKLDKTSKIKLLGNSYITSLTNEDEKNTNIDLNGFKLYINGIEFKN